MVKHLMAKCVSALVVLFFGSACAYAQPAPDTQDGLPKVVYAGGERHIDIVFCIDTSGSMQSIIDSAKQKVWSIINELIAAKPVPILRVGLIAYEGENERFQLFQLTDDLDKVYSSLHSNTFITSGGNRECVGRAIREAVESMQWDSAGDSLKMMFVIGNEPANQDSDQEKNGYRNSASAAVKNGIIVNAIYGGDTSLAESEPGWQEIAKLADGTYARIDLSGGVVTIATPYDAKITELNDELNKTYIPFGTTGEQGRALQEEQDANSIKTGGSSSAAERAQFKANAQYQNYRWDLVDASKQEGFKLEEIKKEEFPAEMQSMTPDEQKKYIADVAGKRTEVQGEINKLALERQKFLDEEIKKQNLEGQAGFDKVVRDTIRSQAEKKNFKF